MGIVLGANGQSFQEGFMLQDYSLAYRYNPALAPQHDFLSLFQYSSYKRNNVGASAFLYPIDGEVVTFLNSKVPADTFAEKLKDDNYLTKTLDFNLFSCGFYRKGATHTFEANVKAKYSVSAPGELFMFAKTGTDRSPYDFNRLRLQGDVYVEMAYGYSRKVDERFSFGGRIKLLAGFYSLDFNVTQLDLTTNEDHYQADIRTRLDLTNQTLKFGTKDEGLINFKDFAYKGLFNYPTGGGLAVDLGIAFKPVENLTVSASLLDLGTILWYYGNAAVSSGTVDFTGLNNLAYEDFNKDGLMAQLNNLKDDVLGKLTPREEKKKFRFQAIPFSAELGAKYSLPFYESLSLGFTGQYIGYQWMPYWESRFALAINPVDWFDCTANIGAGEYGLVWGAAASIHLAKIRFNAGLGNGFGGTMPHRSMPVTANLKSLTVGLTYDL